MTVKSGLTYWVECDGCGARPETDYYELVHDSADKAIEDAIGGDWYSVGADKHACDRCVSWDDEGEAVLARVSSGDAS